jgi:putative tryptophan/tyrosine transport system substrate-binding protein
VDRRTFARGMTATLLIAARRASAQSPVIAFIRSSTFETVPHMVEAFRKGLAETGAVEGQNITIEFHAANDDRARLEAIVADVVRRRVAVIVSNSEAARLAKAATSTIPIVFATGGDPVRDGLVASLGRPGGNVTGVNFLGSDLGSKKLELIHAMVPMARLIGVLEHPNNRVSQAERADVETAARALGVRVIILQASSQPDFDRAFATLMRDRAGGLVVTGEALFTSRRKRLIDLAAQHRIPTIHTEKAFTEDGGLTNYGASITDAYRQVGVYAGRILKGEKPADLPVLQPTKFEFLINLKTAKALGLTIPPAVLARADEVIQ